MKILQLCCFTNLWPAVHQVESVDLRTGRNILDLPYNYGQSFDLVVSAPPCDQFTKANSLSWINSPDLFIEIAQKCFDISIFSGKPWLLENPPGRIETFIPALTRYRIATWHGAITNKEYVVYSNMLLMFAQVKRYGKPGSVNNHTKKRREMWQTDFVQALASNLL